MGSADPGDLPQAQPGAVLAGKYRVVKLLGRGGMGLVVRAQHIILDEPVAVKFLLPEFAKNEEASARFVREAKAALRIKNEHVTRVLDVGNLESGEPFMVMELLEGQDLAERIKQSGAMPTTDALDAIIQACRGLGEAHVQGVIHRDIKPANLFLTKDANGEPLVKLIDFGISKLQGDQVDALTKTSATMGSALYMSPEQMTSSRNVDGRTDLYALGVTLFEALTGRRAFDAQTMPMLCAQILNGTPTPLFSMRPDLNAELIRVVHASFAKDPNQRFATAAAFAQALAPYASDRGRAMAARIAGAGGARGAITGASDASMGAALGRSRNSTLEMEVDSGAATTRPTLEPAVGSAVTPPQDFQNHHPSATALSRGPIPAAPVSDTALSTDPNVGRTGGAVRGHSTFDASSGVYPANASSTSAGIAHTTFGPKSGGSAGWVAAGALAGLLAFGVVGYFAYQAGSTPAKRAAAPATEETSATTSVAASPSSTTAEVTPPASGSAPAASASAVIAVTAGPLAIGATRTPILRPKAVVTATPAATAKPPLGPGMYTGRQ